MNWTLSKSECTALRGFAIIGIFLHNYVHWLGPMVKENEYQYHQKNVDWMLSILSHPSWELPLQLFSFFGHYGVPVFLFLSGYGLVKKYEATVQLPSSGGENKDRWAMLRSRYIKLFPMMFLGFALFTMVDWMTPGHHHWAWTDVIAQLTMTINLLPNPDKIIWPGPYWFFGLMMQLYAVYAFLMYRRSNSYVYVLIALCWAIQMLCIGDPEGDAINRIRYNCIGGMLPFGIGVLIGRGGEGTHPNPPCERGSSLIAKSKYYILFLLSLLAVFAFSLSFSLWLWVPLFIVTLHITMVKILPSILLKGLEWVGVLSSAIFVCHPITRKIFIPISRHGDIMDGLVLYIVATILLAMLFQHAIKKMGQGVCPLDPQKHSKYKR